MNELARFNRLVQDELRMRLGDVADLVVGDQGTVRVANYELSASAMVAVGGGGPFNEIVLLTDVTDRKFLVARRSLGSLTAQVQATFQHADSDEDSARVYLNALRFLVMLADDRA